MTRRIVLYNGEPMRLVIFDGAEVAAEGELEPARALRPARDLIDVPVREIR